MSRVKEIFAVDSGVRVWGRPPARGQPAAVCSGSGGDLISQAQDKGAQVYITGEVRHHQVIPAREQEFAVIEVGHFASEVVFMGLGGAGGPIAQRTAAGCAGAGLGLEVMVAAARPAPCCYR